MITSPTKTLPKKAKRKEDRRMRLTDKDVFGLIKETSDRTIRIETVQKQMKTDIGVLLNCKNDHEKRIASLELKSGASCDDGDHCEEEKELMEAKTKILNDYVGPILKYVLIVLGSILAGGTVVHFLGS